MGENTPIKMKKEMRQGDNWKPLINSSMGVMNVPIKIIRRVKRCKLNTIPILKQN